MLSLETEKDDDSARDSSDDDISIADMLASLAKEKEEGEKDSLCDVLAHI